MNRLRSTLVAMLLLAAAGSATRGQEVAWATRMGGTGRDGGNRIAVDGSGNSYVTGDFEGSATFGTYNFTGAGSSDIFVEKLDSGGTVLWARRMGGTSIDTARGIAASSGGTSYVTGAFHGTATFGTYPLTSSGDADMFIEKLNPSGTVLWVRNMGGGAGSYAYGLGIAVDSSGNSYVTGYFGGTVNFGSYPLTSAGDRDIFVEKLDPSGAVLWARKMGGTRYDYGADIAVDSGGNSYVTGVFQGSATFGTYNLSAAGGSTDYDIFVEKLDSTGTVLWARRMGSALITYPQQIESGDGITVDSGGNSYVTGGFLGTATFGTITLTSTDSYYQDIFVEKLDPAGTVLWAKNMGAWGPGDLGDDIAVDSGGNSYVTGVFSGTATFGSYTLASADPSDCFVEKLDPTGTVLWAKEMGGTSGAAGGGIAVDSGGNSYVTGQFKGTATFGPYPLTSAGDSDIFVEKLPACSGFTTWYRDTDGDGFGNPSTTQLACTAPAGYVGNGTDCDDNNVHIYPGAPELCDGVDNQCPGDPGFGLIDEISFASFTNPSKQEYAWTPLPGATLYQVAWASSPTFGTCSLTATPDASSMSPEIPGPGGVFYYLVRAAAPYAGTWGRTSSGITRDPGCD